jgi:hypothetical protein
VHVETVLVQLVLSMSSSAVLLHPQLRLPSATAVALLPPPLKNSLQSLLWLNHRFPPAVPPSALQCRAFHLWRTATARTTLGMHKVVPFYRYEPPTPAESTHRINLWDSPYGEVVAENVTLEEVYNKHIRPGHILYLCEKIDANRIVDHIKADQCKDYAFMNPYSTNAHVKFDKPMYTNEERTEVKQHGELKKIPILATVSVDHYQLQMDRTFRLIEGGCKVEFLVKMKNHKIPKEERLKPGPEDMWPWMHNHLPHLRPDFILKAMPEGTVYLIEPVSDGKSCMWVMALPSPSFRQDLTRRLFKVKGAITSSIAKGMQDGLPVTLRTALIESGNDSYVLGSSLSKNGFSQPNRRPGTDKISNALSEAIKEKETATNSKDALGASAEDPKNRCVAPLAGTRWETEEEAKKKRAKLLKSITQQQVEESDYRPKPHVPKPQSGQSKPRRNGSKPRLKSRQNPQ